MNKLLFMYIIFFAIILGLTLGAFILGYQTFLVKIKALAANSFKFKLGLPKTGYIEAKKANYILAGGSFYTPDTEGIFIFSVLEDTEIPLITFVNDLSYLNFLEFTIILSLFLLLFRHYWINLVIIGIFKLNNKYFSAKEVVTQTEDNRSMNKLLDIVDMITRYLIVFLFIALFWIKFIHIFWSQFLADHIETFVKEYNNIQNSNLIFLIYPIKYRINALKKKRKKRKKLKKIK